MFSESPFSSLNSSAVDIDWERLAQLSEGNSEFELELLEMFTEDLPIYIDEIKNALNEGDLATLGRVAHQIKGSSGNVGAKTIEEIAANLEKLASQNSLTLLSENIPKLEIKLAAVKQLISQKYLNG